jgi:hypothetical protein
MSEKPPIRRITVLWRVQNLTAVHRESFSRSVTIAVLGSGDRWAIRM